MTDQTSAQPMSAPSGPAPLVVVSNRLPFRAERRSGRIQLTRSPGGLVSALEPVLHERGGIWIGWPGIAEEDAASAGGFELPPDERVGYRAVPLSAHEVSLYYGGFANRTLWPLFHYFVGRTTIDGSSWRVYERVNDRFAEIATAELPADAIIWVHDYQLLRVAHHARRRLPDSRIAFFLHIPFPAADVFGVLPWARTLLRGMLAADLVGFQVGSHAEHFMICAERLLGCEVDRTAGLVRFDGREISVQAHPISVDVTRLEQLAQAEGHPRLRGPSETTQHVLGVDRLDYTKGIHERLLAVERLLDRHPAYHRRMLFTQLLVPSRERVAEYAQLKKQIDETIGRINGRFSEPGWSPIRYLVRSLPPEELVPLYRQADVALVTPLRDGMNLVSKEYVVSQLENDGVLILSEMAGAAEELQEALIVNPFDIDAVADALHAALSMPDDERYARMAALRDRVRGNDVYAWVRRFLESAEQASLHVAQTAASPVDQIRRRLGPWLAARPTVALFLDYDGTLTPTTLRPEQANLSDLARRALEAAARRPNLDTVIVSGRMLADVQQLVGVPGLTYVGNHGFEIEGPGVTFRHAAVTQFRAALDAAAEDLARLAIAGAWVERKGATLAYHVRETPVAERRTAERRAQAVLKRRHLHIRVGKCVVEGRPPLDWHKGSAVLHVLAQRHGVNWPSRVRALYVGDDTTDEDAFRSLRGIGRSILVAPAPTGGTAANYRLPDPDAVLRLVLWLASGAFAPIPG